MQNSKASTPDSADRSRDAGFTDLYKFRHFSVTPFSGVYASVGEI
jgi:hypothetical protein